MFAARRIILWSAVVVLICGLVIFAWRSSRVSAAYTCLNGGDHGGATWDPATDCPGGIAGVHTNISTLSIATGETATVQAYTGTQYGSVSISATTVSIVGTLTANSKGYPGGVSNGNGSGPGGGTGSASNGAGGGGYGGTGGNGSTGVAGGSTYGLALSPSDLGSGGGSQAGSAGPAGGGAIWIVATGTVTVSGTIASKGANAGAPNNEGGGSGGSIYIGAGTFTGAGTLAANGGNGNGTGGGGGGGRVSIYYSTTYSWTGTALTAASAAPGGSGAHAGSSGTVMVTHHAYATGNSITMSTSAAGGTGVSYKIIFTPVATTTIGGIVVDMCDDTPVFNSTTCAYPSSFNWGGATPSLTVNSGMGSGWTAAGVQGGAASGKSQVLELSNATPQSITAGTPLNFTITSVTNLSSNNHSFYARIITFNTSGNMTSEYTVSGTTRSASLQDSLDHGGVALSTSAGISLSFQVPESLAFCVSGASMGSNCSGQTTPAITLGHTIGSTVVLDSSQVDKTNVYVQTSTNANNGVVVNMFDTVAGAVCGGLSSNLGVSCGIPAVNTSCAGSCSATTITAGTSAIGMCVSPGSGSITAAAPYNGVNCGTTGTTYGLDDATATNVRSRYGSKIFSSSGVLNGENDTLVFAATASTTTPAGAYKVSYALIATATF